MKIKSNHVVAIEYTAKDRENNELIDTNKGGKPLEFLLGAGQVIAGLENALLGRMAGDYFSADIAPEDAYGIYRPDFIQEVPKEQFEGIDLKEGMTLFGQGEDGSTVQVIVKGFNDKVVMVDYNHPLAGKTLAFEVTVLDVREPTEQEVLSGGVGTGCCGGGCGCSDQAESHHEGGCCGGGHSGGCGCH